MLLTLAIGCFFPATLIGIAQAGISEDAAKIQLKATYIVGNTGDSKTVWIAPTEKLVTNGGVLEIKAEADIGETKQGVKKSTDGLILKMPGTLKDITVLRGKSSTFEYKMISSTAIVLIAIQQKKDMPGKYEVVGKELQKRAPVNSPLEPFNPYLDEMAKEMIRAMEATS